MSIKHKIVNQDLLDERAKLAFDKDELAVFLAGGEDKM
jgi:hypothetical protein